MNREQAMRKTRQLLKKSGVDTSEMTDAEVVAKVESIWDALKPEIEKIMDWLASDEVLSIFDSIFTAIGEWWESLPEEVRNSYPSICTTKEEE